MPSWKIENAATAAAVAFPLPDAAGIVGEGEGEKALYVICCILWNMCRRRGTCQVPPRLSLALGVERSKVADAAFDSPSR